MSDFEASTIPGAFARAVGRGGGQIAVIDGDTTLTYSELWDASRRVGAALIRSGISAGDRVAIWAPNCSEWIIGLFALSSAGATLVPVNTRYKGVEAADIISRSRVRALFTVSDFLGCDNVQMLRDSGVDLPDLQTVIVISGAPTDGAVSWSEFEATADPASLVELDRRAAAVNGADVSDILFTSGTTGVPKGVVQTHAGTMGVADDWVAMTGLHHDDRYLMINPYFHMFGLKAGILASVSAGLTMYPVSVFDAGDVLAKIATERITVLPGPPTLYQSLLDSAPGGDRDLTSLRIAVTGAADIPVTLMQRVIDELPFKMVLSGYGLSEGGTAAATDPGDSPEIVATTVGRPRPGFELRIVDATDTDVAPGESGEILLRGTTVMSRYLDDPDATAATLSSDGWLRTGDIGSLDDDGRLRIVGRSKDMFIVGGFNAYPAEIENALLRHREIAQAAVIGIPDERLGEVGMAFIVLTPTATATPDDIVSWARGQMANYKVPRRVEILTDLPINAAGKIEKRRLKERSGT